MSALQQGSAVGEVVQIGNKRVAQATGKTQTAARRARKTVSMPKLHAAERRTIGQFIAAVAASFLPIASYVLAHFEAPAMPMMWGLVAAALMFSAPTLAEWAQKWCRSPYKAWGFTILLEGTMVASTTTALGYAGLAVLVVINCHAAWSLAGKSLAPKGRR